MTNEENELINLVRTHDNPTQAILVAVSVILDFLAQQQPNQQPTVAVPLVLD